MDFALNEEQKMLEDSARRFFAERHPLTRARKALPWSNYAQQTLWRDMAEMGWFALLVPQVHDGLGLGMCEAYLVAEAAGRQLLNLPLISSAVLLPLLLRESAQPDANLVRWVNAVASGAHAFAGKPDPPAWHDHAQQCTHHLRVRGVDDAIQPVRVGLDQAPANLTSQEVVVSLEFTMCQAQVVAPGNTDASALEWTTLDMGGEERARVHASYRLAEGAQLLGATSAALDTASTHAREREQFGKPIGSYQAIKHQVGQCLDGV